MSKLPEEKILRHIEKGVSQLTPNHAEEIWDLPVTPADGSEWYLDTNAGKVRTNKKKYLISTLAACFALCILSTLSFQYLPSASVYLDVNPSVQLKVNYRNRVTSAVPCNSDADAILEDMDLKGTDLDVALYAILGSMVHHGYLTEAKDTILVSVHSANSGRAQQLELEVTDMVTQSLDKMICAGEVLSQQIDEDAVDHTNSTPGKTAFIDDLEDKYPQLKQENLDGLTVDEIVSHLNQEGLDYSEYQDYDRDEDDEDSDEEDDDDDENDEDNDDDDDDDD